MPSNVPIYLLEFTKADIEAGKLPGFIENTADLLAQPDLVDFHGKVHFSVGGYDNSREITEIPEVRAFYKKFREAWPYWLFFVDAESLKMMVLCTLHKYTCVRDDKKKTVGHIFDDEEVKEFIQQQTPRFLEVCQRAGIGSLEANAQLQQITKQLLPPQPSGKMTTVRIHPHARQRMAERGALESEIVATVESGEQFPAKFGRTGFRRNFKYEQEWHGRFYRNKQLEVFAEDDRGWLVITVIVRYS